MSVNVYLNKMGYPKIAEMRNINDIPGIGEKIKINTGQYHTGDFEVTEVRKDNNDNINIFVNRLKQG
ncbi:hypothetical protein [Halothermothrix orenii]|uniref:hypothetical protein n=1 Tax=Halothermothrix orenii TaxID=31909 RepID=UPI0002E9D8D8|nr:hypothetical protein [Halothermothrix orenii]